jgi:CheY-like chemotaxis protein
VLLKDKRVFILEDNVQNRVVYQMIMINNGGLAYCERWGNQALQHLESMRHVDLIILDLMLPGGVSGFDVCDQIRALPAYATIPIVAVSAMDPAIAIPQVRAKGFNGFIAKPIDNHSFPRLLNDILEGKEVWHTGERALI